MKFLPHDNPFPQVTTADQFTQAWSDILHLLKSPNKELSFLQFGDTAKNAITQLSTLLHINLQQTVPAPKQSLSPPRVIDLDLPRVLPSSLPRVDIAVDDIPYKTLPTPRISPEQEFTLNQPSPNYHHMKL